jgi:UDP-N-acetylmuramyl pentapeptide phosphotransferase/UDP-N-acetylglucosamine-1-phosphate transferase
MQIVARNASISAWFVIALAAYPIVETLFSIYRRKLQLHTSSMQPDAAHLHSLVFRRLARLERAGHEGGAVDRTNARVAPFLWLHGTICFAAALLLRASTPALIAFVALYAIFYVVCYRSLERDAGKPPPARHPQSAARR